MTSRRAHKDAAAIGQVIRRASQTRLLPAGQCSGGEKLYNDAGAGADDVGGGGLGGSTRTSSLHSLMASRCACRCAWMSRCSASRSRSSRSSRSAAVSIHSGTTKPDMAPWACRRAGQPADEGSDAGSLTHAHAARATRPLCVGDPLA